MSVTVWEDFKKKYNVIIQILFKAKEVNYSYNANKSETILFSSANHDVLLTTPPKLVRTALKITYYP